VVVVVVVVAVGLGGVRTTVVFIVVGGLLGRTATGVKLGSEDGDPWTPPTPSLSLPPAIRTTPTVATESSDSDVVVAPAPTPAPALEDARGRASSFELRGVQGIPGLELDTDVLSSLDERDTCTSVSIDSGPRGVPGTDDEDDDEE
jgi:hypothetical protein